MRMGQRVSISSNHHEMFKTQPRVNRQPRKDEPRDNLRFPSI